MAVPRWLPYVFIAAITLVVVVLGAYYGSRAVRPSPGATEFLSGRLQAEAAADVAAPSRPPETAAAAQDAAVAARTVAAAVDHEWDVHGYQQPGATW